MKIVLAVDGSKYGRWSMQWVPYVPFVAPPKVIAVHALDVAALKAPFVMQPMVVGNEPFIRAEIRRIEEQAKRVSAEVKDFLSATGISGKVIVERDAPAPAILKHARHGGVIMLGSRGLTGLDRFMLGSVSHSVALHARVSVLVVKQPPRILRRVLFATDGSKSSRKAMRFLVQELRSTNIEIILIHVLRHPQIRASAQTLLDTDAEGFIKAGYTVRKILKVGYPAEEIIKLADRQKVDLLVCGAQGLGAIARFFTGSVSTKLIQHSSCSCLVVR